MSSRAIRIMAKEPVPGLVKTRLSPPLSPEQSAQLASAFLRDTVLLAMAVPDTDVQVILATDDGDASIRTLLPPSVEISVQPEPGLAAGMSYAIETALDSGASSVIVIGADAPTLPLTHLMKAFKSLEEGTAEVVVGPSEDGGYYLIGASRSVPALFEGIDWGTPEVYRQTLSQAEMVDLQVSQLPAWYDIDELEQLHYLACDLSMNGELSAPATRVVLNEFRQSGIFNPKTPVPWHLERTNVVATSPWRDFVIDTVTTHSGEQIDYYYMDMPDAAFVVPVTSNGDIILVRQYRHPIQGWMLEVPAGAIDAGLFPISVAEQELREEIGGTATEIRQMGRFNPLSGSVSLWAHIFLALGVELGPMEHEKSELIHRVAIPHQLAFDMAKRGEISEGQSAMALLHCEDQIREWLSTAGL